VLLTGQGDEVRNFDTLAEAVQGASDGDTIEVRGSGPFISEPVRTGRAALTIRAGRGFRPVIRLGPNGLQSHDHFVFANGPLVLEGLELQRLDPIPYQPGDPEQAVVCAPHAALHMANCRVLSTNRNALHVFSPRCDLRNCEILADLGYGTFISLRPGARVSVTNCVTTSVGMSVELWQLRDREAGQVRLERNTLVSGSGAIGLFVVVDQAPETAAPESIGQLASIEAEDNVFQANHLLRMISPRGGIAEFPARDRGTYLTRLVGWHDRRNIYGMTASWLEFESEQTAETETLATTLDQWNQLWGVEGSGSSEGDVGLKLESALVAITPDDFRLRPDSAGYRAGPDGKDLGADVDLVGPGEAYERWKRTPEYQQWLEDTGQLE
jgi:hypothetical protein